MVSDESEEEKRIFTICSRTDCPRDIKFHCENFMNFQSGVGKTKKRTGEEELEKLVLSLLSSHFIEVNPKVQTPKLKFLCSKCKCQLNDVVDCLKHLVLSSHQRHETAAAIEMTRKNLPEPSEEQCIRIEECINKLVAEVGIPDSEMKLRQDAVVKFMTELRAQNIDCFLVLYGSSVTALGFQDSDINVALSLNLHSPKLGRKSPFPSAEENELYAKVISFFQSHPRVSNVFPCPLTNRVIIQAIEDDSYVVIPLSLIKEDEAGIRMSNLLLAYVRRSPLVRPLVLALRYWAKLCGIDDPQKEGLPAVGWITLVISFLQRNRYLPVLDPETLEVTRNATAFDGNMPPGLIGRLWIQLLRSYSSGIFNKYMISMTGFNVTSKDKNLLIQDCTKRAQGKPARISTTASMREYIVKKFTTALMYFAIPRTPLGPLYDAILPSARQDLCSPYVFHQVVVETGSPTETTPLESVDDPKWDPVRLAVKVKGEEEGKRWAANSLNLRAVTARMFRDHMGRSFVLVDDVRQLGQLFPSWMFEYKWDHQSLTGELNPPVNCKACNAKKHFTTDCPDEILASEDPKDESSSQANLQIIQEAIAKNFELESLTEEDYKLREEIRSKLQEAMPRVFSTATLKIFGSSINGLGNRRADLDMCLIFDDESTSMKYSTLVTMHRIKKEMYKVRDIQVIYFVQHARIPIIKFKDIASGLDGDISCCNTLAVINSELIRTYVDIDPRVKMIGLLWKRLLKACDLSSASKGGGLSSYGFSLMLIYFFQRLEVPVLPVLQELQRDKRPPVFRDGWDVQYFNDINNLKDAWPQYGQNRDSCAELWLKLLKYYGESFDWDNSVITISKSRAPTKLSKFWTQKSLIAIEDPFIASHNVGGSLSLRMSIRIINTIRRFREVFCAELDASILENHKDWLSYFTDPSVIQFEESKMDKGDKCPICDRRAYHMPDCPQKRKKRKLLSEIPEIEPLRFDEDIVM